MKFAFFGTDDFSVAIIEKLISDFYYPTVIVTMPDRPVGRKQVLTSPAIKSVSDHHRIPLLQPEKVSSINEELKKHDLDLLIVASYGKIIPQSTLDIPKKGSINVHTSLLPAYRGSSPIQAVIRDGLEESGITIMMMDAQMDHGAILFQRSIPLDETETYRSLHSKLAPLGAETLTRILPDFLSGKLKPIEQNHEEATYTEMIKKENAKIDWSKTVQEIDQLIRSSYDWPIAWSLLPDQKRIKIIQASPQQIDQTKKPGTINFVNDQIEVSCQNGVLLLERVQVEGKKEMTAKEFMSGYHKFNDQLLR
jgi:methionyl-tRNA formyltransferase